MRNELDEKLKKTLGSPRPLDVERFTNNVMEHLRKELRREEQYSFLREFLNRLIVFDGGGLKAVISTHLAQAGQSKTFASKYSTVFKVTAGLSAVTVVVILTLIFIRDYAPSTSVERSESSPVLTRLNDTSPSYALNERIDVHIEETRPCDILPPLSD